MINNVIMLVSAILIIIFSYFFEVRFIDKKEKGMTLWFYAWIAYAIGIVMYSIFSVTENVIFLEIRKLMDMINIVFLLVSSYNFMHLKGPDYWKRFSLYMVLLAGVCMFYGAQLLTFYLPISLFQIVVTVFLIRNVLFKWNFDRQDRILMAAVYSVWGIGKAFLSLCEVFMPDMFGYIAAELAYANIMNICAIALFMKNLSLQNALVDNLYKKVVDSAEDAMFYFKFRPVQAYEYISPACLDITGYSQIEFYSNPGLLQGLSSNKEIENFTYDFTENHVEKKKITFPISKKTGENVWIEMSGSAVVEDGVLVAVEGMIRDVTAIHTESMEQIRVARSRNMLFSYISHELRTPITSLAGYITALEDGTFSTEEEQREAMDVISSKTQTLKKLIDDLDQMSKLETHQFTFDFQVYNVGEVVNTMIANNIGDIENKGYKVEFEYNDSMLSKYEFVVDFQRIGQVFTNLVTNAIKYSPDNKRLWVSFDLDEPRENFICTVRDEGVGISGSDLNHVFDSFFRAGTNTSATKYTEGRGLGLSLSKEIVERHNGEIYADSKYGKGSTFTFIIPLFKEE